MGTGARVNSLGRDARGRLYVVLEDGSVRRLAR
jgi:hypothetical protein